MAEKVQYIITATDQASAVFNKVQGSMKSMGESMSALGAKLTATVTLPLGLLGNASIKTAAQMQGLDNAIRFASGTSDEAARNTALLAKESERLGLDVVSSATGFKTLLGSLQGTNISMQQGRELFVAVGQAATVLGMSADQTEGSFLALGQMMSKGTVSSEELRQQLGERLPGAMAMAAEAMGLTSVELEKQLQLGNIYADEFIPKFTKVLQDRFVGGVEEASNSLQANLNRMNNAWTELKTAIGEALAPIIPIITEAFTAIGKWFTSLDASMQSLIVNLGLFAAAAGPVLVVLGAIVTAIGSISTPALAVIGVVGALTVAMTSYQEETKLVIEYVSVLWGDFSRFLGEAFLPLYDLLANQVLPFIRNLFELLTGIVKRFSSMTGIEWNNLLEATAVVWEAVKTAILTPFNFMVSAFSVGLDVLTGNWGAAWDTIKDFGVSFFANFETLVLSFFSFLSSFFGEKTKNVLDVFVSAWESVKTTVSGILNFLIGLVDSLLAKIEMLSFGLVSVGVSSKGVAAASANMSTGISSSASPRANGGQVMGNKPYLVGERGPELIVPQRSGHVIPNNQLGGGGITVNINGGTYLSEDVAEEIGNMIVHKFLQHTAI